MCGGTDDEAALSKDLKALVTRRAWLRLAGAASASALASACDGGPIFSSGEPERVAASASGETCVADPTETAGPFPADGSNRTHGRLANLLSESGIVRRDLRSKIGAGESTYAAGAKLDLTLSLVDVATACRPLSGHAIYLWHCDAEGRYSIYDIAETDYLRGVGVSDDSGHVRFTTIIPGCYPGRAPHMHFEVYPSLSSSVSYEKRSLTSQLAIPPLVCKEVYGSVSAYRASQENYRRTPALENDGIFSDNTPKQLAAQTMAISGSQDSGYQGLITIGLAI
ncbi:MAG: hypothetical protein WC807_12945 [Hyphomicrobium sp.]|jgi:protocatechuate 3,4-dioxygenase beta subunit